MTGRLRRCWRIVLLGALLGLGAGCTSRKWDELLAARKPKPERLRLLAQEYRIQSPDRVAIVVGGPYPWDVERTVGVDDRVLLPTVGWLHVGGRTARSITLELAEKLSIRPDQVSVRILEHRSQQLFLHGEVKGLQRVVAYRGPETVLEMLERTGGITAGAAPRDVQVVRAHVADGKAPEVFQVDLEAILVEKDDETNIHLRPFDQIYIGETRRWSVRRALPPWLRPLYEDLLGLTRKPEKDAKNAEPKDETHSRE